ncbi:MAG: 2-phospho-L-lactate transferase [Solirubrobacterales bacterium]|nr:2-phospho-L-lactate transferase [Solirubrobacterales bacterium]
MSQDSTPTPDARSSVVVLAGGTGGAKLASGFAALPDVRLSVIANTGDDVSIYGARVCPDPDLIIFHLAGRINERGWGLDGDTFHAMAQLGELDAENWFQLGDKDLAIGIDRAQRLAEGQTLTQATAALAESFGIEAAVLPMCDEPVATQVVVGGVERPFQEFMIVDQAAGPVEAVVLEGIAAATPTPEVLSAIASADVIVIGPSNPAISIGPILAVPGMTEAIQSARAPVVAVSPLVHGNAVKGPTEEFLRAAGVEQSAAGIAQHYAALIDGLVADQDVADTPTLLTDLLMEGEDGRRRLAAETLAFAMGLEGDGR